jgi:hypothetical protein
MARHEVSLGGYSMDQLLLVDGVGKRLPHV